MIFYIIIALMLACSFLAVYLYMQISKYKIYLDIARKDEFELKNTNTNLEQNNIKLIQQNEKLQSDLKHQEQLILEFENLKKQSNDAGKAALFDLGKQLSKELIDLHKKENKETRELSEQNIKKSSEKFNSEFERIIQIVGSLNKEVSQSRETVDIIKNSLLSPSGAGALAEITLENILKSSGLRSNIDFTMQYNITAEDDKSKLRPDSVVFLPSNKLMVIDAKASKFLVDEAADQQDLSKTMNLHLRSLASKNYAENVRKSLSEKVDSKNTEDLNIITLMFVPSEHAVEKIIEADKDFMNKAWQNNIFPVGPAGLMNMLSFAKFQISEQMVMHNNLQIIEEVKKLIKAVGSITEHSARLGNSISSAANNYDKFAASFNRSFLSRTKKLRNLGLQSEFKKEHAPLARMQIVSSKSELIDVAEEESEIKELISENS